MDFLALYIGARLIRLKIKPLRLLLSAAIGGLYGVLSAVVEFNEVKTIGGITVIGAVLCAMLMSAVAFGTRGTWAIKATLTYAAVNVGLGGLMSAIYTFVGRAADRLGIRQSYDMNAGSSPLFFVIAATLSGVISLAYGKYRAVTTEKKRVSATITVLGKSAELCLLCDSGNLLREPILGRPVIVVSGNSISAVISENTIEQISSGESPILGYKLKARYIPVRGVTGSDLLFCFSPEKIAVDGKPIDAVVAVGTIRSDYGGCDGIIPQILVNA